MAVKCHTHFGDILLGHIVPLLVNRGLQLEMPLWLVESLDSTCHQMLQSNGFKSGVLGGQELLGQNVMFLVIQICTALAIRGGSLFG